MIGALVLALVAEAGVLQGHVVDEQGQPVPHATVIAYDHRLNYATTTAEPDGTWSLDLPPNPYRVRVLPPWGANLVERYHTDTLEMCAAPPVLLEDGLDMGAMVLSKGAVLRGRVLDRRGEPVQGAQVFSLPAEGEVPIAARGAITQADGRFTIAGVPPGHRVVVQVVAPGWPTQYHPGVVHEALALEHVAPRAAPHDVGDIPLLDGIAVTGSAQGPEGPVPHGEVNVYAPSQLLKAPITAGTWEVVGLPAGDVLVWASASGLANTYFPEDDRPGARIPAQEGDVLEGIELRMPPEARITGQIAGEGDLSKVNVLLYNSDRTVGVGAPVASDGSFSVGGLHGGRYTLQVFGAPADLVNDMLRGPDGEERVLEVGLGEVLDLGEVEVPQAAVIHGTITDTYTGEPVYGAYVYARPLSGTSGSVTSTARDGTYTLAGLEADAWQIWTEFQPWCSGDPDWAARYYPDHINPVFVGAVTLQEGERFTWDATLPPDRDHDRMDDVWEARMGLDPHRDDADEDPDGDGYTNYEEYLLGTDPLDGRAEPGCACGGGRAFGVLLWPLAWVRRRRDPGTPG